MLINTFFTPIQVTHHCHPLLNVELVKQQTKEIYYQNADGKLGEMDLSAFLEKIENDYKQLKNDIRNSFE